MRAFPPNCGRFQPIRRLAQVNGQMPISHNDPRFRILQSAGPIFAENGFERATVREICSQAAVNLAAVNYYFGDKERLYLETVRHARESREQDEPFPVWDDQASPEARLRGFVETLLRRMVGLQTAPWQVRLMMREILQPTQACRELVRDYFRPTFELLLGIVKQIVTTPIPRHRLEQLGFSLIGQCLYYRVAGDVVAMMVQPDQLREHYSTESLANHIAEFTLAALHHMNESFAAPVVPKTKSESR